MQNTAHSATEYTPIDRENICAISTPQGIGGIAIIRLAGPQALEIAARIWQGKDITRLKSHTAHLGYVLDSQGQQLDQAVITTFHAPNSYTGQDTVEFSVHGSRYIQATLIQSLIKAGARLAQPGEFTRRAFTSGRIDLARAEAVADIIAANSRAAHRVALAQLKGNFSDTINNLRDQLIELSALLELELDFSDQDIQFADRRRLLDIATTIQDQVTRLHDSFTSGQAIKDGIPVAIVGPTNAGKSSLLNTLTGEDRAIVSDIHGTTRDTIQELITIGDYQFRIIDTAGLRETHDTIERIGIQRTINTIRQASIIITVADNTVPLSTADLQQTLPDNTVTTPRYILALNKSDLTAHTLPTNDTTARKHLATLPAAMHPTLLHISASTGQGLDTLRQTLIDAATAIAGTPGQDILVTNIRHAQALAQAATTITQTIDALNADLPADLIAQHLRATIHHLSTITGDIPSDTILSTIFSRFCVGK